MITNIQNNRTKSNTPGLIEQGAGCVVPGDRLGQAVLRHHEPFPIGKDDSHRQCSRVRY